MKVAIATLVLGWVALGYSLDCSGPLDIVLAVPGSDDSVPDTEFHLLEDFLISLLSYYDVAPDNANVGLVLYGSEPVVFASLGETPTNPQALNTRVTLLSQRELVHHQISGGQNVPKVISKVHEMLSAGRSGVPKIGVIMTYGNADLTSSNGTVVAAEVEKVSRDALDDGINLFATSTAGTLPGFPNITGDFCRLFSLGNYTGLNSLLPYLASSTCYVLDDDVTPSSLNCFPKIEQPPVEDDFTCTSSNGEVPDPTNCAYYYDCSDDARERKRCGGGLVYDPSINMCNHGYSVPCYHGLSCPSEYGRFPHPDCSKFLNCFKYMPHVQSCAPGTLFNRDLGDCDHPWNVQCEMDPEEK